MENTESLLLELDEFNANNDEHKQINSNLENFIEQVAKTGTYIFPWQKIRNLYLHKLKYVLNNITPSSASHVSTTTTTTAPTSLSPTSILGTSLKSDFENQTPFNSSSSFYMFMQNSNTTDLNNVKLIKDRLIERMESFTSAPFTIQRISELLLKPNNHYNRPDKYLRGLEKCIMVVTTVDPTGCKIFVEDFLIKNYIQSQTCLNTSSTVTLLTSQNPEENQIKSEDSVNSSLQHPTATSSENQQNDMDISTTTSTITNVSSIENFDSNENSENEEMAKEMKEENIENVHLENFTHPIVDGYSEINKSDSAIDISESVASSNQINMESAESVDTKENETSNFNINEEKETKE